MDTLFVWLARLMFAGIFLIAFGMLFRVYAILVRKDPRHVADWRGRQIADGASQRVAVALINLVAAGSLLLIGFSVLFVGLAFTIWSGSAAFVLWSYYFALQLVVQRSHRPAD